MAAWKLWQSRRLHEWLRGPMPVPVAGAEPQTAETGDRGRGRADDQEEGGLRLRLLRRSVPRSVHRRRLQSGAVPPAVVVVDAPRLVVTRAAPAGTGLAARGASNPGCRAWHQRRMGARRGEGRWPAWHLAPCRHYPVARFHRPPASEPRRRHGPVPQLCLSCRRGGRGCRRRLAGVALARRRRGRGAARGFRASRSGPRHPRSGPHRPRPGSRRPRSGPSRGSGAGACRR